MALQELVLFGNPAAGNSYEPICVVRFNKKKFDIHAIDENKARSIIARIKTSPLWGDFANREQALGVALSSTFGPLVKIAATKGITDKEVLDALSKMKFKVSFPYDAKLSYEDRRKEETQKILLEKFPMLRKNRDEKYKRTRRA